MKTIISKQKIPILVDDDNFEKLSGFEWSVYDRYAETVIDGKTIKMHRLILGLEDENTHSDHINGVTTDNRKENLRICNRYQNQQNRKINKNSQTGAKGIVKLSSGHFRVRVQSFGIRVDLGVYKTIEEAINVREKYAREKHGEFYRQT
jgi:hypothetical protein